MSRDALFIPPFAPRGENFAGAPPGRKSARLAPRKLMHAPATERETVTAKSDERVERAYHFADLSGYTLKQRLAVRAAGFVFPLLIRAIGRTLRFNVEGQEHWDEAARDGRLPIYTFWHDRIFAGTYFFRGRRIVIITSQSFDGEYIARFIQRLGYGALRGS